MADRLKSTRAPEDATWWHRFVCGEVLHVAARLKATSLQLSTLADALPLPDRKTADRVLSAASAELFAAHPALSLHVDLEALAYDLTEIAGRLESSAHTNLPLEDDDV